MDEYEFDINEKDLDDIVESLCGNVKKDSKEFADVMNLWQSARREIYLGDISSGTGLSVDCAIRFWNEVDDAHGVPAAERKPIKIFIDSCGGSLTDTFTMIDAIQKSVTPVWTIAVGCTYSGGFFTFITGHRRLAYKHASFLYHEGGTGSQGTANQFENYAQFYKRQMKQLKDIVLQCTNIDEDMYSDIKKDDFWMDADDAIKYGCADEII